MSNYDPHGRELDDLLRQVDSLLDDEPQAEDWLDDKSDDGIDIDEYTPIEAQHDQEQIFYQNYSNSYGQQVRNYQNGYGGQREIPEPSRSEPTIPAYNADFQSRRERRTDTQAYKVQQKKDPGEAAKKTEYRDFGQPFPEERSGHKPEPKAKSPRRRKGCGCSTMLIALAVVIVLFMGLWMWVFDAPESDHSIGDRKRDTATILICGTDADRTRTDTMMLLYLSASEDRVGLLSLPRDTYTRTSAGNVAKLNSAYGRNGGGQEGKEEEAMEAVLDYVQDIIGYRPDGYILVDMNFVPEFVDAMGGVDMDVPQSIDTGSVTVSAGMQHLDGEQVLALLRHRKSYSNADLGRVEVQREVIKACMDQWISLSRIDDAMGAISMVDTGAVSSLSTRNYLWIAKTILTNMSGGIANETLPGYADYVAGGSYYILDREAVAEMINESFNPYEVDIDPDDLNIAG